MKRFPVTFGLVALIVATFLLQGVSDALDFESAVIRPSLFAKWAITSWPTDPIRLFTGTLLHAGVLHLVMNGWMLLQVGSVFELLFGAARLLIVYVVSAFLGAVASSAFLEAGQFSVGASGAIFGVAGGLLVMIGTLPARHRWAGALRIQLAVWAVATLILGSVSPTIDNAAHIGGLIAGSATALLFRAVGASVPRSGSSPV